MIVHLTPSHVMALRDLILEHILGPHTEVYLDIVNNVETTPEQLLQVLGNVGAGLSALDAFVDDAQETHALYASMRTEQLQQLQAAFELDQAQAMRPESIAFGGGRLALIATVLKTRDNPNATNEREQTDG